MALVFSKGSANTSITSTATENVALTLPNSSSALSGVVLNDTNTIRYDNGVQIAWGIVTKDFTEPSGTTEIGYVSSQTVNSYYYSGTVTFKYPYVNNQYTCLIAAYDNTIGMFFPMIENAQTSKFGWEVTHGKNNTDQRIVVYWLTIGRWK